MTLLDGINNTRIIVRTPGALMPTMACFLRFHLDVDKWRAIAVITDIGPDNPGLSITNAAEHIMTLLARHIHVPVAYFEHYPQRGSVAPTLDLVTFEKVGSRALLPTWRHCTDDDIAKVAGMMELTVDELLASQGGY